ncbi:GntR family transcriptional regulator [Pseudomonas luteola]|uniref:GntR family transcriptional regulator n=1 Tax=Pseudomonas luteola TaxID=47886 RepID=UPI00123947EE|nr:MULTISPECIES: GntR family transcriptional regulator [Pseudomonas]MBA1246215.1 GntR family transcriptional regulator [Pseudomonas zeshuii]QEU26919.1 GntR family transcriptional regulator [Pseudomonas luteola]
MSDNFPPATSDMPLYKRIKQQLQQKFAEMPPLSPVPSERELCTELNVSRTTIRKTLAELERLGNITRLPGKGTFTSEKKYIDHELQWFIGFHEDAKRQNKAAQTRVIRQTIALPSPEACLALKISADTRIFVLERLRYIDGEPICLVSAFIPLEICTGLISQDFSDSSLYEFLRSQGISTLRARRSIEVKVASDEDALYLSIEPHSPVLLFQSTGYTHNDKPFEFVQSRYPAFKARFESEVYNDQIN